MEDFMKERKEKEGKRRKKKTHVKIPL